AEIDGLALLMRAVRDGLGATLQPGAAISHLDNDALRVIGVHNERSANEAGNTKTEQHQRQTINVKARQIHIDRANIGKESELPG
ncbi:hypothetical protein MJN76_31710, partial [Salmonella enterica subsp. enterica serovar Anatum]|nr:hypothetical protein [Salmonella enterica subsp. enterica serovar Anatum]